MCHDPLEGFLEWNAGNNAYTIIYHWQPTSPIPGRVQRHEGEETLKILTEVLGENMSRTGSTEGAWLLHTLIPM